MSKESDPNQNELNLPEGERRRDEGIKKIASNGHIWMVGAAAHLTTKLQTQDIVTADDLRDYAEPHHHNCKGAVFNMLRRAGVVKCIGSRKAKAVSAHARDIKMWQRCTPEETREIMSRKRAD